MIVINCSTRRKYGTKINTLFIRRNFLKEIELKSKERFLLGSIIPDAYMDLKDRDKTHFANRTEETTYFDFNLFREKFDRQINEDSLYLGYYMHLVEDVFTDNSYIGMSLEYRKVRKKFQCYTTIIIF